MGKYFDAIVDGQKSDRYVPTQIWPSGVGNLLVAGNLLNAAFPDIHQPTHREYVDRWDEMSDHWAIRLLAAAAAENDVEGCKRLLVYILPGLGVRLPKGVLVPFRWKVGRPMDTAAIYVAWLEMGGPETTTLVLDGLAKRFYPEDFLVARSDVKLRKKLRDRIGSTIRRWDQSKSPATKSTLIS